MRECASGSIIAVVRLSSAFRNSAFRNRSGARHAPRSLRKVLDHAAANNYGVAAFNVNNMEQIQAIMEAAKETDSPVIIQASRGARSYSQDAYLKHLMLAAAELYPQIPDRHAPGSRQQPGDLRQRDRERLHERDDGRLAEGRRQDAGRLRLQREGDRAKS